MKVKELMASKSFAKWLAHISASTLKPALTLRYRTVDFWQFPVQLLTVGVNEFIYHFCLLTIHKLKICGGFLISLFSN